MFEASLKKLRTFNVFGRGMKNDEAVKDSRRRDERLARCSARWVISALCDITEGGFSKRETKQKGSAGESSGVSGQLADIKRGVRGTRFFFHVGASLLHLLTGDPRRSNQ